MNAFDFKKIADKFNAETNKKSVIKTKRKTSQFLKFILKHIKKQAKKGFYYFDIPKDIAFIDYEFIIKKLEDLNFHINKGYRIFCIEWGGENNGCL